MRHLFYTVYQSGESGLSNGIMSIEIGVALAFLSNRFLLLDGNVSPPANVVSYQGRVDNKAPSRITDLLELPVPWSEPAEAELESLASRELTDQHLMDSVFYLPGAVDIQSADAAQFARGRTNWLCETAELSEIPVLRVSEEVVVPGEAKKRRNLGFYSYFFYFDDETRRAVYQVLQRMQPKAPYAELARRVAQDLGSFNAVHIRRGDFKVTYGVTVLDRHPWEAIESLDNHFSRTDRLLICTDERGDPFFDEIKSAWSDHVFIDHHILDNFSTEFSELPQHDSIALAYLSQLVAAESKDFIGTMTSTFTSMIQRYRGNRGKEELFKFLWNELPDPGDRAERGRHPVSECVPLDKGIMVQEFEGPYSWNRYSQRINPAWMREWPEGFLTDSVLATGALAEHAPMPGLTSTGNASLAETELFFEGLRIRIRSRVPGLVFKLSEMVYQGNSSDQGSVFTEINIEQQEGQFVFFANGQTIGDAASMEQVPSALISYIVPLFAKARARHSWLGGLVFQQAGRTIVYTGDVGGKNDSIADVMCSSGWELLADEAIPLRLESCEIVPFTRCSWPKGAAARIEQTHNKVTAIVHATHHLHGKDVVTRLSPAVGAAELIRESIDFRFDRDRAVERLCKLVEQVPVFKLSFSRAENVPRVLGFLAQYERPVELKIAASGETS